MRKVLPLATLAFFMASAAFAQVEPRMTGDWHSGDSDQSLHIQADGRYQTKVNGRVVESGRLTATNGSWKLKSDSGRADTGTVSFISGNMMMHGGMSGSWSHSSPASSNAASKYSPPSYHSSSPLPSANTSNPMGSQQSSSYASNPTYVSPQPNASPPPQGLQTTSSSAFGPEHRNVVMPSHANSQDTPPSSSPGAPPRAGWKSMAKNAAGQFLFGQPPQNSQPPQNFQPPQNSQTYSSMYGHGNNGLPGYSAQNSSPSYPQTAGGSHIEHIPNSSPGVGVDGGPGLPKPKAWMSNYWRRVAEQTGAPIINADEENAKMARQGRGMPANQTTQHWEDVQQQNRPSSPGWQVMPRGGYIPVMKDNKARKFWGH